MKTIRLHGVLAEQFGEFFELDVASAKEGVHAIACQIPDFKIFMLKAQQEGMMFAVFMDEISERGNIGVKDVNNITGAKVIHVMPRIMGAGGKAFAWIQVIAGAALIGFSGGFASANGLAMIGAGASLMLGGVASLLMPTPDLEPNDEDGNKANKGFGGPVTTVATNNPVPLAYGEYLVGGFVGSGAIYTEDTQ